MIKASKWKSCAVFRSSSLCRNVQNCPWNEHIHSTKYKRMCNIQRYSPKMCIRTCFQMQCRHTVWEEVYVTTLGKRNDTPASKTVESIGCRDAFMFIIQFSAPTGTPGIHLLAVTSTCSRWHFKVKQRVRNCNTASVLSLLWLVLYMFYISVPVFYQT